MSIQSWAQQEFCYVSDEFCSLRDMPKQTHCITYTLTWDYAYDMQQTNNCIARAAASLESKSPFKPRSLISRIWHLDWPVMSPFNVTYLHELSVYSWPDFIEFPHHSMLGHINGQFSQKDLATLPQQVLIRQPVSTRPVVAHNMLACVKTPSFFTCDTSHWVYQERKTVCAVRRHDGSLCE